MVALTNNPEKRFRAKVAPETRERQQERQLKLQDDIQAGQEKIWEIVEDIAKQHGRSVSYVQRSLHLGGKLLKKKRKTSAWNAFVHFKMIEINDGVHEGGRTNVCDYMKTHHETLYQEFEKVSQDKKDELVNRYMKEKEMKRTVKQISAKSAQKDVQNTFAIIEDEMIAVADRTGIDGFFVATRNSLENLNNSQAFATAGAHRFCQDILKLDIRDIALKMEGYLISGMDKCHKPGKADDRRQIISYCRKLLQEGFAAALKEQGLETVPQINYKNHERQTFRYGVQLVGWPASEITNPAQLKGGIAALIKLKKALDDGACKWVVLSEEAMVAQGKHLGRRKTNNEKATIRKKGAKSREVLSSSSSEAEMDSSSSNDSENGDKESTMFTATPAVTEESVSLQ